MQCLKRNQLSFLYSKSESRNLLPWSNTMEVVLAAHYSWWDSEMKVYFILGFDAIET